MLTIFARHSTSSHSAADGSAADEDLACVAIAVPLLAAVLAAAYFDDWWLFAVAVVAAVLALHELYTLIRRSGRSCLRATRACSRA